MMVMSGTRRLFCTRVLVLVVLAISLGGMGCRQTRPSRSINKSGFLKDYSQLREGEGKEAQLVYVNTDVDYKKYDKIMIESVTMWTSEDSKFAELSEEERQALTDYFYTALHKELEKDYQIVDKPGSGVLSFRAAITEAEDANVTMNVITSTIPQFRLLSSLGGLATDVAVIVGTAGVEGEVVDSVTQTRLLAAVDRRVGTKTFQGMFSDWSDVEQAFEHWAKRLRLRLAELRGEEIDE